jgi:hypothetical protein
MEMPVNKLFHGSKAMSAARGALAVAAGLALVATLESCGGCDGNATGASCPSPPPPTPTPVACIQSAVYTDSGAVPSSTLFFHDFPLVEPGRLDLTLDWTNAPSPMGLYLVPAGTCTLDEFNQRTCNFLVRSDPPGAKPRKVSAANLQAGNYRVLIANYGSANESAAVQLVLSKGSNCPAHASVPPSASVHDRTTPLTVERAERR